jgi:hypothetical protein
MFSKNAFGQVGGDVHFVIFQGWFYIESRRNVMEEETFAMVKKQLKKTGHVRQTHAKRPSDAQKQQYYSFGIFVGDY